MSQTQSNMALAQNLAAEPPRGAANGAATITIGGRVLWHGTDELVPGAVVKAVSEHGGARFARTQEDGAFSSGDLRLGKWSFTPLHERGISDYQKLETRTKDDTSLTLELWRIGTVANTLGQRFFAIVCVALAVLALLYIGLHWRYPPAARPINAPLAALLDQAEDQAAKAEKLSTSAEMTATVTEIRRAAAPLLADANRDLTNAEKQTIGELIARTETSINQNQRDAARAQIEALRRTFETPARGDFFWATEPWRYLEALLWGVAGVLINQIISSAGYLRFGKFYKEGIVLNIAQLISISIVALIVVLILSLATLKITMSGGNEIQLDLADPRILVTMLFIIGLNFWRTWDFLQSISGHIPGFEQPSQSSTRAHQE